MRYLPPSSKNDSKTIGGKKMKNECSVVRDILPLFLENMVSDETAEAIKEHFEVCPECASEFEALKMGKKIEKVSPEEKEKRRRRALVYDIKDIIKKGDTLTDEELEYEINDALRLYFINPEDTF